MSTDNQIDNNLVAAARKGDTWHFINQNGETFFQDEFTFADNFSNGLACVSSGGTRIDSPQGVIGTKFHFINLEGEKVGPTFDEPSFFSDGFAIILHHNNKYAVINSEGWMIKDGFESALPYSDGLAAAVLNDTVGYINEDGEWEFLMKSGDIVDKHYNNYARVKRGGKVGYINRVGQWIVEPRYESGFPFSEGFAVVKEDGTYNFINDDGLKINQDQYTLCGDFSEGLAAVKKHGKWGYIGTDGELVIDFIFDDVRNFSEGLAAVMKEGKVLYINSKGNTAFKGDFSASFDFKNSYAIAMKDGKLGFIDTLGQWAMEPVFDRLNNFVFPDESNPLIRIH